MNFFEGQIIEFKAEGERSEGIILEIKGNRLEVFDTHGETKNIEKEEVTNTDIDVQTETVQKLLNYFKCNRSYQSLEELAEFYKDELINLKQTYEDKIEQIKKVIRKLRDMEIQRENSKKELMENI